MKLYARNIVRKRLREDKREQIVDRDGIIWSIDTNNYYCLVKIQGSDTTIKAYFPRNWKTIPVWLKKGNAVRVRHRSGVQGYIEVIGHGRAIPSALEGGNLPTPSVPTDGIISGMNIVEYDGGGMNILVTSGIYRIDGTYYTYTIEVTGYIIMDDPAPMVMGSGDIMGDADAYVPIVISAAPSAGNCRYDAIVIGIDGDIDVIAGATTAITTEPTKPSVPADHVLIGYLFIYGGMTSIPQDWIGVEWGDPYPTTLVASSGMIQGDGSYRCDWDPGDDTPVESFTLTVKDQYGYTRNISKNATAELLYGTGGLGVSATGSFSSSATKVCTSSVTFYYERNQLASPELFPTIKVTFPDYPGLLYTFIIILLDSSGDPIDPYGTT